MSDILAALKERVLLCDGGMGSTVQNMDLDLDKDFRGAENCTEILNISRPDAVKEIHSSFLRAGSDIVQTNSFGGSPITLGEFDLSDEAFSINYLASQIALEAIDDFKDDGRQRFVLGSIGPGTKLPSLGHIDYDSLEEAFAKQAEGLTAGGCHAILIETCQDPLQVKSAVNGAREGFKKSGVEVPIFVQVTVETTGTMLVGTDIAAAGAIIHALGVDSLGLNCATGPQEMAEHVKWLTECWPELITLQPNAGLPELKDGQTVYPLTPREMSDWLYRFVTEDGLNMIGGCCGALPEHIEQLHAMLQKVAREQGLEGLRPAPLQRNPDWTPSLASLYMPVPLRQENAYFSIGERCNANGSRRFRDAQDANDWETCIQIAKEQQKEMSHALDVCTAFVGRDEVSDMHEVLTRLRGQVTPPLVIDSTELIVLESALKLYGGKAAINSINFEDGEEPPHKRLELARKYGAAVIALTIDEDGMAKEADRKVEVAKRLRDFAVERGLAESDLLFDPLTFTICTGNEDDRELGIATLDAIERISKELPECQIILGLSNISFGLKPVARHVLNSVFLHEALQRGMTGAILHTSKIKPLHQIADEDVEAALNLIYNRREKGDPLHAFIDIFKDRAGDTQEKVERSEKVDERLAQRIVDGDTNGLEDDLHLAMSDYDPLEIINNFLLSGMKVVGELFGAGKMQLPFVLQSAETMKKAVAILEPYMERMEGQEKGTIVLATVKGDVHDIGKNLVDIILTNNGYKVVNLGIKQPIYDILKAAEEHKADAVGMSGLLVKSTVIMRENLEEMTRQGFKVPVILGGAALTRNYVEQDCAKAYGTGGVAYARDAFDGLNLMAKVKEGEFDAHIKGEAAKKSASGGSRGNQGKKREERQRQAANDAYATLDPEELRARRIELAGNESAPTPPFWGSTILARVPSAQLVPYLNERMLYQFQWGYRKQGRKLDEYMEWAKTELRPILRRMLDISNQQDILRPQASYGYWKAAGEGNDLILFEPDGETELTRFKLPRQPTKDRRCIADYVRDIKEGPEHRDVVALQVVTMGQHASEVAREWFAQDRYQDYLYLHGLGVEMAEAMAEYVHKRIRAELGYASEDAKDMEDLFQQNYRGSRYSFGYPACPDLEQQVPMLELLEADKIGVEISDEYQLHPEQSTSAIVLLNKHAKYFSI